MKPNCTNRF